MSRERELFEILLNQLAIEDPAILEVLGEAAIDKVEVLSLIHI